MPLNPIGRAIASAFAVVLLLPGCRKADKGVAADTAAVTTPLAAEPSPGAPLDCTRASSDIEKLVCSDPKLSALDQKLGTVYKEAEAKQGSPAPAWLTAGQRGWIKGRDDCGKSSNQRACVDSAYTLRIAEIQATSLLVPTKGPVAYTCPRADGSHDEIQAMYADTDPASVVLERADKSVIAFTTRPGSGARYQGANVTFRERGGKAQVNWFGTELKCHLQEPSS